MQTLKINLHGESWTLKKFECSEEDLVECLKVAAKMKLPLKEALLNPFFYYNLRLPKIPSLENLPGKKITGLLNSPKNQIEILLDGKKIRKHYFSDLLLLFPMFEVDRISMLDDYSPGIYVEQKAIGFIASYELKVETVNLDDLQFKLLEFKDKILLQKPTYQNKNMLFRRKETLLIYQNSFEV
ncbi:hypothetical protein [Flavobacterium sp. W22_SRS_FP1]|uniref:hypothetical protein n=1 Tax=Flavobacterium sp. W22_SRS_FP1 TaxID=3240276 RepID=UPI003F93A10B